MTDDFVTVLLIEDDNVEAGLIRDELVHATRPDVKCDHVQRLLAGIALLEQRHFDVVLLDLNLPDGVPRTCTAYGRRRQGSRSSS